MPNSLCEVCGADGCPRETRPNAYELHITVDDSDITGFRNSCLQLGVKPIVLELASDSIDAVREVMTSCTVRDVNGDTGAINLAHRQADWLRDSGQNVLRVKVETVPWHAAAPSLENGKGFAHDQYFESHLNVVAADMDAVYRAIALYGARVSYNPAKTDGSFMVTLRERLPYEVHSWHLAKVMEALNGVGATTNKSRTEFALTDSAPRHDAGWIDGTVNIKEAAYAG